MKTKTVWLLFFLMCLPVPVFAVGGMHYESLQIHPFVSLQETYSDNIFAVPDNTDHDWITTITPGISLSLPYGKHEFNVDYKAVFNRYSNFTTEDTTDQYANAVADFKIGRQFGLKLSEAYTKGHEPRTYSAYGEIEEYEKNAASITGTYQLADRSKIRLDYTRASWNFKVNDFRDRQEDLVSAYLYYRFLPRTSAFFEYDFRNYVYDDKMDRLDSRVNSGLLGLMWEMTAATKGTIKGGLLDKKFEAEGMEGIQTWTASMDIIHAFSDNASLKMTGVREVNESGTLDARYYTTTGAAAQYTHKLTAKIAGVGRASYGVDEYSNAVAPFPDARKDKTVIFGVGLKYQMYNWLEFLLDYDHRNRDSNIDEWDAVLNTYSFTVNFAL